MPASSDLFNGLVFYFGKSLGAVEKTKLGAAVRKNGGKTQVFKVDPCTHFVACSREKDADLPFARQARLVTPQFIAACLDAGELLASSDFQPAKGEDQEEQECYRFLEDDPFDSFTTDLGLESGQKESGLHPSDPLHLPLDAPRESLGETETNAETGTDPECTDDASTWHSFTDLGKDYTFELDHSSFSYSNPSYPYELSTTNTQFELTSSNGIGWVAETFKEREEEERRERRERKAAEKMKKELEALERKEQRKMEVRENIRLNAEQTREKRAVTKEKREERKQRKVEEWKNLRARILLEESNEMFKKVYVGKIHFDDIRQAVSNATMRQNLIEKRKLNYLEIFRMYGAVHHMKEHWEKGYVFVVYDTHESAQRAIAGLMEFEERKKICSALESKVLASLDSTQKKPSKRRKPLEALTVPPPNFYLRWPRKKSSK